MALFCLPHIVVVLGKLVNRVYVYAMKYMR